MAGERWTTERVLGLAPDAASVKAARGLTRVSTWSELGCTDSLVFGRCQGSGKTPYQVSVDLTEPAFKCSCPSRKFPCKHGLALLLLWVEHGDAVGDVAEAAGFADDWQQERSTRAATRQARAETPVDPVAQAARQAEREATMTAGLEDLRRWMADLVRNGVADLRSRPYAFWDDAAARLVDAQVPGLADRVRDVGGLLAGRDDWPDVLVAEMGRWHLAVDAWSRRADLPAATAADLRAYLGWPWRSDEAAALPTVADEWIVAGVAQGDDDGRISSQRTWLWGRSTQRWGVVLDFAAAGASLRVAQVVGSVVTDAVRAYPGSDPVRMAFSGAEAVGAERATVPGTTVDEAVDGVAGVLAADPWRARVPVALTAVVLVDDGQGWWLADATGRLPLAAGVEPWDLLARSGGGPAAVVAEWEAGVVRPLTVTVAAAAPASL